MVTVNLTSNDLLVIFAAWLKENGEKTSIKTASELRDKFLRLAAERDLYRVNGRI